MQCISIVEKINPEAGNDELSILLPDSAKKAKVTYWSVDPLDCGDFLIRIFDEWVKRDVGDYFIVIFGCITANWMRCPPALCTAAETCVHAGVVE